ncbi:cobalamin biosynthesis central domain-containing protein [Uliginosibacterium gangwonense]|uniref:cobalamin biosynthesis central domain-containing protein n=1 Tax=Uliginosibacterium gangwonense TaxID=392736 RepID=UPI00036EEF9D|nr:cobalamin biosynthesis central domain-containing protein [Uliginosibacterium gangwonense]
MSTPVIARSTAASRTAVVSITRHGITCAGKIIAALPGAHLYAPEKFAAEAATASPASHTCYAGKLGEQIPILFAQYDAIVAVVSLGALVRLIAPCILDKSKDPAIVVVDEGSRFVIPVLSGHLGGANELAGHLATALGATPVLTTASDSRQTLAVDLLGRELGWHFEASHDELVRASAAVVNDEPIALVQEAGSPDWWRNHANGRSSQLPKNIHCFTRLEEITPEAFSAILWISDRDLPQTWTDRLAGKRIIYRVGTKS